VIFFAIVFVHPVAYRATARQHTIQFHNATQLPEEFKRGYYPISIAITGMFFKYTIGLVYLGMYCMNAIKIDVNPRVTMDECVLENHTRR
jgi:hypothetical protein